MHLPVDDFDAYIQAAVEILQRESGVGTTSTGTVDHRAIVEQRMRQR